MGNTGVIEVFTLNFVISKIGNALKKEKVVEFTPWKTKTKFFFEKIDRTC
jgi:menaquinone-dependent protoporphyrinogen IX oxidase